MWEVVLRSRVEGRRGQRKTRPMRGKGNGMRRGKECWRAGDGKRWGSGGGF
jgi:hypothetical protein